MLLVLKVSEENNAEAKKHSYIALTLSLIALLVAIISAGTSVLTFINPSAMQVYSVEDKPVFSKEIVGKR